MSLHLLDMVVVGVMTTLAALYLFKKYRPRKKTTSSCGCGTNACPAKKVNSPNY